MYFDFLQIFVSKIMPSESKQTNNEDRMIKCNCFTTSNKIK